MKTITSEKIRDTGKRNLKGKINTPIILALILGSGVLLALRGMGSLIPYFLNLDEAKVINSALDIIKTGDLDPHLFKYGGFPIYLLAGFFWLFFQGRAILSSQDFSALIQGFSLEDQGFVLFYLGRLFCLGFGLLTIYLAFIIGRKAFNERVGLLAAGLVALCPIHIDRSQWVNVDVMTGFWVSAAFYFALRFQEEEGFKFLTASAVCSGLAMATKYNFLSFLPLFLVIVFRGRERQEPFLPWGLTRIGLAAYLGLLFFFLASPFCFLDFPDFFREMTGFFRVRGVPHLFFESQIFYRRYLYQIFFLYPFVLGPPLYLAALGGGILLWLRSRKDFLVWTSFPIGYFLVGGAIMLYQFHPYVEPLLPITAILGAFFILELIGREDRLKQGLGILLLAAATAFFFSDIVYPHYRSFWAIHRELGEWFQREVKKDEKTLMVSWFIPPSRYFQDLGLKRLDHSDDFDGNVVVLENPEYIIALEAEVMKRDSRVFGLGKNRETYEALSGSHYRYRVEKEFAPPAGWGKIAGLVVPMSRGYRFIVFKRTRPYTLEEKVAWVREKAGSRDPEEIRAVEKVREGLEPELKDRLGAAMAR